MNGQPRDINTLGNVEITGISGSGDYFERFDNKVDGTDPDEVDLQKRAMAKKIYQLLIADNQIRGDDPSTENVVENF